MLHGVSPGIARMQSPGKSLVRDPMGCRRPYRPSMGALPPTNCGTAAPRHRGTADPTARELAFQLNRPAKAMKRFPGAAGARLQ